MFLLLTCLLSGAIIHLTLVLASDSCAAPSPCECNGSTIYCYIAALTAVPIFRKTNTNYTTVYLNNNHISRLEDGAFLNLTTASAVDLHLDSNRISYIADGAFTGLEDTVLNLRLGTNRLGTLPNALTRLNNLTELEIDGLETLDPDVMASIGRTLESFYIRMDRMTNWPQEMKYLLKLTSLNIGRMRFADFPDTAFRNFEDTLLTLNISNSALNHPLVNICNLHRLTSLVLYYLDVSPDNLVPNCSRPLETVTNLDFTSHTLQPFPNVLSTFPNLTNVSISCPLEYIDDRVIPDNNMVTDLIIVNSQLRAVPVAVKQFKLVRSLNLRGNNIVSIDRYDFNDMPSLRHLYMNQNPIVFVSELAFGNSSNIQLLTLYSTRLTTIPKAILHLPHLADLYLHGTPFKCNCEMKWLLTWDRLAQVNIHGYCPDHNIPISDFVKTELRLCNPSPIG